MKREQRRSILVWADWDGIAGPILMGTLFATPSRLKEAYSFEYHADWLESRYRQEVDPELGLFAGPQYSPDERPNFGAFLDSSPDRWGRLLMQRREDREARKDSRPKRTLVESDYLLGVHDQHRVGALRFKTNRAGPFLDDRKEMAAPPMARLRDLEHASLQLEQDGAEDHPDYDRWLRMLIAPGGSLGGARPKASVLDGTGVLWIAKFPSRRDGTDIGAWEMVAHRLAVDAGIEMAECQVKRFRGPHRTFLTRRFDRTPTGHRLHLASAMTLLRRSDGDDHTTGVSYLDLAEVLIRHGAQPDLDLAQLWRRIVFFMCVSNTDDHLRNHSFLQVPGRGWKLAPAYDVNPVPDGDGLRLNVSESDNAQDLDLARQVAMFFRVKTQSACRTIEEVVASVRRWKVIAKELGISRSDQEEMISAFRLVG